MADRINRADLGPDPFRETQNKKPNTTLPPMPDLTGYNAERAYIRGSMDAVKAMETYHDFDAAMKAVGEVVQATEPDPEVEDWDYTLKAPTEPTPLCTHAGPCTDRCEPVPRCAIAGPEGLGCTLDDDHEGRHRDAMCNVWYTPLPDPDTTTRLDLADAERVFAETDSELDQTTNATCGIAGCEGKHWPQDHNEAVADTTTNVRADAEKHDIGLQTTTNIAERIVTVRETPPPGVAQAHATWWDGTRVVMVKADAPLSPDDALEFAHRITTQALAAIRGGSDA